jgi:uncharacterized membrane protein
MKEYNIRSCFVLFTVIQLLTQSCFYDNEQNLYHIQNVDCTTVTAKFTVNVMPIISSYCATSSCHNSTGVGGVVLQTYDQIKSKIDRIHQRVLVDKTMPPNGALTTSEINIIQCWISGGSLNN